VQRIFTIRTRAELANLPAPRWLVMNMLRQIGFSVLYGQPGTGKSFVALDIALSIATGSECFGHPTPQGNVVYLAGEGHGGLNSRISAWEQARATDANQIYVIGDCPDFRDPKQITMLADQLKAFRPALIVVDTLARHLVGGDENSAKDMGEFIKSTDHLRDTLDSAVLLIHHSGKKEKTERGSSALRGAADTMIEVTKNQRHLTLICTKQKDDDEFTPISLCLEPVVLADATIQADRKTSCIVRAASSRPAEKPLSANKRSILNALARAPSRGLTYTEVQTQSEVPEGSINRELKELEKRRLIQKRDDTQSYTLNDPPPNDQQSPTIKSQSDSDIHNHHNHPPKG
jgi:hypothetical protein